MLAIGKTMVLLGIELIIEYLFGTLLTKKILKKEVNSCMSLLTGFIAYQALFQVIALVFIFTTRVLHHLTAVWVVFVVVVIIFAALSERETVKRQVHDCLRAIVVHKHAVVFASVIILAFCYYASINGEDNEDARYYIALMTTSVDTDSMFKYNVYNGYQVESLYLRRVLATFEMQSAVYSQLSQIHPLLIARVFRSCQNILLTSVAVMLCSGRIFWKNDEKKVEKSLLSVGVFWMLQLLFANTIYTPAAFVLYRAYEAKAFTANFIVLLGLYYCIKLLEDYDRRMILIIAIFIWGSAAMSTSAMVVACAECVVLLVPVWIQRRIAKNK